MVFISCLISVTVAIRRLLMIMMKIMSEGDNNDDRNGENNDIDDLRKVWIISILVTGDIVSS